MGRNGRSEIFLCSRSDLRREQWLDLNRRVKEDLVIHLDIIVDFQSKNIEFY